ncbi:hypothetical protein BC936DRAFT_137769 [Jimgerdemannia flammicorona]|uniref:Uncharacterized protein n=2 Tax=Jimgerdemannia flammicorona TaxID=994334 RepID=A0A433CWQ6_9FUNG|nr:hypothetical protein BC936DRAFT_137769 [Jimgerdemannia flammicorona]RUS34247.1 hypothetical protein BC938DRAFT_481620 [Jimgerdemannia flammicorona]
MGLAIDYMKDTKVLIYVLDSVEQSKPEIFEKGKKDMRWLLETYAEDLRSAIIITIANKQDLVGANGAKDVQELGEMWMEDDELRRALEGHQWRIFPCTASKGEGIDAVLDYVYQKTVAMPATSEAGMDSAGSSAGGSAKSSIEHSMSQSSQNGRKSQAIAKEAGSAVLVSSSTTDGTSPNQVVFRRPTGKSEQIPKFPVTPWEDVPNPYHLSDDDFLAWFDEGRTFLFFDHHSLIRVAYLYMRRSETSTERRSDATRRLLYCLRTILRSIELHEEDVQNESNTTGASRNAEFAHDSIVYSETHALFWLQMVSYSLIKHPVLDGEGRSFDRFLMRSPELWDGELWRIYYTPKIFHSEKAQNEFMPPDKKQLPNAFKPASVVLKGSGLNIDYKVVG